MIIVVSGGFDPLHSGHINMFKQAYEFGTVWVIVNTDEWLQKKKGYNLLSYDERELVLSSNKYIDKVIKAKDDDDTVVNNLKEFVKNDMDFAFANGGDRIPTSTPEMTYCLENNIPMLFNIGGTKTESSSKIVRNLLDQATK
jgi:D-beta-D-heptose 7-phosphate kinase/D-beta-D-heptose 1-phosphate adenosyltransferase